MTHQIESAESNHSRSLMADVRHRWWQMNYHALHFGVVKPFKHALGYDVRAEGVIPESRPLMLVPVHRTSIDIFAISEVLGEFVSYVSTDNFGHNRIANWAQKLMTSALGSIVWQKKGIANPRARALALARDVEHRLSRNQIVAAFTQGEYQPNSVDTIEDGLLGLLHRHETRHLRKTGQEIRVPIVPVGLEYDHHGNGMVFSNFGRNLANVVPFLPHWIVPALGSSVTVRFGEPQYFDGRTPSEVAQEVMREAAALSNIPYRVD